MTTTYLFSYGSLMNPRSRILTGATGEAVPARVTGLRRGWYAPVAADRITYLAVARAAGSICNGAIFRVDAVSLPSFDAREKSHRRVAVQRSSIELLQPGALEPGAIWTYECVEQLSPTDKMPIAQSYVDVVMDGCLEIGESFAREFVALTAGWKAPWVDDRFHPRYPRHVPATSRLEQIDALLDASRMLQFRQP